MQSAMDNGDDLGVPEEQIITLPVFRKALRMTIGKNIPEEELSALAYYVMNFFGFDDYVIDNILTPKDRDVFYTLEEHGLLGTMQEEVLIKRGKLWRIHYWVLRKDNIIRYALMEPEEDEEDYASIYEHLSEDVWEHRD